MLRKVKIESVDRTRSKGDLAEVDSTDFERRFTVETAISPAGMIACNSA